jgi:WD40 repeat protein/serine/threonine protein kinase
MRDGIHRSSWGSKRGLTARFCLGASSTVSVLSDQQHNPAEGVAMLDRGNDAQILYGLLAVRLRFVSLADVSRALAAWSTGRASSLQRILVEEGLLDEAAAALVEAAVARHLDLADGDASRSLESFTGNDALAALCGALEQTVKPAVRQDPTIAKLDARGDSALGSVNGCSTSHEHGTEIVSSELDQCQETDACDGNLTAHGSFQVLRPLARGGLGEVFVARDGSLNREVALKLILASQANDPQSKARFLLEAEITGGLEHPGIVPVYALGEDKDGRPFYAMRLVKGETLNERIRGQRRARSIRTRKLEFHQLLNHFVRVCHVVGYAHSRGVLHRDLKPANVMLGKFGETLVVDWGLAKAIERSGEIPATSKDELLLRPISGSSVHDTLHGIPLGTPQYMSPEQALGQLDRIGPASDVYSLGATLYCILTGRSPAAEVDNVGEVVRRVAQGDIPPARTVKPDVPETLDAICRKAMAVRPEDRYASALGLAADVESWLADLPVQGIRESLGQRLGRWERRHRNFIRVSGLALIALATVSIAAAVGVNAARERAEERRRQAVEISKIAEARKQESDRRQDALRRLTIRLTLDRGLSLLEDNDRRAGLLWIVRGLQSTLGESDPFERAIRINLGAWSSSIHGLRDCLEHVGPVRVLAWSPNSHVVATGGDDGSVRLWDTVAGTPLFPPLLHAGPIHSVAFTRDGNTLATASEDQTARFWNAHSGCPCGATMRHQGPVTSLAFSSDDTTLLTASKDGMARLWDAVTGQMRGQPLDHRSSLESVVMTPDKKTVISLDDKGHAMIWDVAASRPRAIVQAPPGSTKSMALSPDGTKLACGGQDGIMRLASAATGEVLASSSAFSHGAPILAVTFNRDGTQVASGSYDTSCRVLSVPDLKAVGPKMEQRGHVWAVAFSPDGLLLAAAADDNTAQVWDLVRCRPLGGALPHQRAVRAVAFSSDGRSLATGCEDGAARIWQLGETSGIGQPMQHSDSVRALVARPDGKAIATMSQDGVIWLWDALTTRLIAKQQGHAPALVFQMAFHPAGTVLVSAAPDATLRLWNGATLEPIGSTIRMTGWVRRIAISPDGTTLVAGDNNGRLGRWDTRTGLSLAPSAAVQHSVMGLAFNDDGTRLVVCDDQGEARIWDMSCFQPIGDPMKHRGSIQSVAFSPDGSRLATASHDMTARIWDARTTAPIGSPLSHRGYVWSVRFSPDGQRVLTGSFDGTAQIWDSHTGRPLGEPMNDGDMIYGAFFSADASIVLTFSRKGSARLWDAASSRPLGQPLSHQGQIESCTFLPGRSTIATIARDRTARLWTVPAPLAGDPQRIADQMSVLTGMELGDDDVVRVLDFSAWKSRRAAIAKSGGP